VKQIIDRDCISGEFVITGSKNNLKKERASFNKCAPMSQTSKEDYKTDPVIEEQAV
jgi:hypothetical protein